MSLDTSRTLGTVHRELTVREHEGRPAHVIGASRDYDTDIDDLWDALTSAERLPRWFLPVSGDLELGGRYQLEGNASGEILACEPPRRLSVTWEYGGEISWVVVTLEATGGGTRLHLQHIAHTAEDFWEQYGPGAAGVGWDLSLYCLEEHFAANPLVTADNSEEWSLTDEGKAFSRGSSQAWCEASIAQGTEPEQARAQAARTAAFYTGEETLGGGV